MKSAAVFRAATERIIFINGQIECNRATANALTV